MNRKDLVLGLQDQLADQWDIIVIGGGATGLGIALDATTRSYKTLLLEQSDFTKGTSSRSTKLIHGGVRYLAKGDILLVGEALQERGVILKNAPHITENQEFIIPVFDKWDAIYYTMGLKFYDLLAGRRSMGKSYFIGRKEAMKRLPLLISGSLKGGVVYHDGQFDDSRMGIAIARACVTNGGTVLNYFLVTGLLKDKKNRITGVNARDMESGIEYSFHAKLVINATGVFADNIRLMDDPASKPAIRPSQGVHIVLDGSFLQSKSAILIPETDDGRVLFAIPWQGKVIIGTTDTPLDSITLEPKALDKEIDFILNTAGKYLKKSPSREDVLCIYAGLRPLAADRGNSSATKEISRRHKIIFSPSGLLSVIGGKWTFYRRMAEETVNKAIKAGILTDRPCTTKTFRLYNDQMALNNERLRLYGDKAEEIEKMIAEDSGSGKPLDSRYPYTEAEIRWICRNEMPVTVEDMLARRTRALFLDVKASESIAPKVAELMAEELGFTENWQKEQLDGYGKLISNYL